MSGLMSILAWLWAMASAAAPLSPDDALQALELADGSLAIDLVAAEPDVVDPAAMAFGENGQIYVVETGALLLGPVEKAAAGTGRLRALVDVDGDGIVDRSSVLAEGLRQPTAVLPAYGGVLVAAAPDLLWLKDADGDGRAEIRVVLFTGFSQGGPDQLPNSLEWGLDNWIYGCSGGGAGDVRPADQPTARPVSLRGRDFRLRIRPERLRATAGVAQTWSPGDFELEPATDGGQSGLAPDALGHWFACSPSRHIRQVALPDHYLRRSPALAAPLAAVDIADHGPAARLYGLRRPEQPSDQTTAPAASGRDAAESAHFSAARGLVIYGGGTLGAAYAGNALVCDSAAGVVHRDQLLPAGVVYSARRADNQREFLVSRDRLFRPVGLAVGPDGGLYVIDAYRLESPVSVPPGVFRSVRTESAPDAGRLYRIRPAEGAVEAPAAPGRAPTASLVAWLGHENRWWRMTAQRLLIERQDRSMVPALETAALNDPTSLARLHALCTLEGLDAAGTEVLVAALRDADEAVRVHALRLAGERMAAAGVPADTRPADSAPALTAAVLACVHDPSIRVRFQLAATLGSVRLPAVADALATLAGRDSADPWVRTILLSSTRESAIDLWRAIRVGAGGVLTERKAGHAALVRELAATVGARGEEAGVVALLETAIGAHPPADAWWRAALLMGLAEGLERAGGQRPTTQPTDARARLRAMALELTTDAQPEVRHMARRLAGGLAWESPAELAPRIDQHLKIAGDSAQALEERISAIEFAAIGDFQQVMAPLESLLKADQPVEIQKAAALALIRTGRPEAVARLLARERWQGYTPAMREAVLDAVFARAHNLPIVLTAIEKGDLPSWAIGAARAELFRQSRDARIRARAAAIFSTAADTAERAKVVENYLQAARRTGDATKGQQVFRANCTACHSLEGVGYPVGPDLSALRERTPESIVADVLDPGRRIAPGFDSYLVDTRDGETLTGLIPGESANGITIRQREGVDRTLLRANIESIESSSLSMMPAGFERRIDLQDMADLLAYLKSAQQP